MTKNVAATPQAFRNQFFMLLYESKRVLVTSHIKPDDDSIASVLVMAHLLSTQFPQLTVDLLYTGEPYDRWLSFAEYKRIQFVSDIADSITSYDTAIFLDGGTYGRFSRQPDALRQSAIKTVCIDQHASPSDNFDLAWIKPAAATTAHLYDLFFKDNMQAVSPELAKILLMGITGDTGHFQFVRPEETQVIEASAMLIQRVGKSISELEESYDTHSADAFALVQAFVAQSKVVEVSGWPPYMTSFISREIADLYAQSDIEVASAIYISHFGRFLRQAPWGVVLYPTDGGNVAISLRSRHNGGVLVRRIAERMGIGGGHDLAAGGMFQSQGTPLNPEDCLAEIAVWLAQNPKAE